METVNGNYHDKAPVRFARGLGWFSIGLGAVELLAPKTLGRFIGLRGHENLIRVMGLREIAAGFAVLTAKQPSGAMTARVVGDALDISLLAGGIVSSNSDRGKVAGALSLVAGVTAMDIVCASRLFHRNPSSNSERTIQTIAVNKTTQECYQFWRNFEKLPSFMKHVESVQQLGDGRSHWTVHAPAGQTVEWDADLTEDSGRSIAWRSIPGGDIDNAGSVEFLPATAGHGTIVKTTIEYRPPAGKAGLMIAKLFGEEPAIQVKEDLRRFKAMIETGEVPTTKGQSSGAGL